MFVEIYYHQVLWVGVGCRRGTSHQLIEMAIGQVFQKNQLPQSAIAGIATIDTKADEVGLVELCRINNLPLKTFAKDILCQVSVPNPSIVVEKIAGIPSVAEAAAMKAASTTQLLISKQIFFSPIPNQKGAVTLAVARSLEIYSTTLKK